MYAYNRTLFNSILDTVVEIFKSHNYLNNLRRTEKSYT